MASETEVRLEKRITFLQSQINQLALDLRRAYKKSTYPSTKTIIDNQISMAKGDLLGTTNQVTVTNGAGAVLRNDNTTLSLPQNIHTGAEPQFAGLKLLTDSAKVQFGTGTDMTVWYDGSTGQFKTSDVAPSDLVLTCGANKTMSLTNVVYDDIRINPGAFDRPGVADPAPVIYYPNAGGIGMYLYEFGIDDFVSFTVQMPHSYKAGQDIKVHLHWTPGDRGVAENAKTVGWKIDYSWANISSNFPDMQTADLSDACDGVNHKHQMTDEVTIDGHTVAKGISSMLLCNLRRTDTGADDTWVSALSGQLPMILEVDFHFPIDTIGSRDWSSK